MTPTSPRPVKPAKDVVWVPTPDAMVTRMLEAVKTTKDDIVYDLGSGDGKIPIAAAKQYGAKATGIEYNPEMAEFARRNVKRAGVENLVNIITGDIFVEDFSKATVVTMYLLPQLNVKLRPIILAMKPGTRVTSHQFDMGDWEPDQQLKVEARDGLCVDRPGQCRRRMGAQGRQGIAVGNAQPGATLPARRRHARAGWQDAAVARRLDGRGQAGLQLHRPRRQAANAPG